MRACEGEPAIFLEGVRENNVVNERVARELGIPYAAEIEASRGGAFVPSDTIDSCHFSPRGGAKMARSILEFLEREDLLRPRPSPAP